MSSASIGSRRARVGVAVDELVPPDVALVVPGDVVAGPAQDDDRAAIEGVSASAVVGVRLQRHLAALAPALVLRDQHLRARWTRSRSASESAEKPPKTTTCGAPIRAHASIATGSSGTIPM